MTSLTLACAAALLLGPPGDSRPPVQTPKISEPEPGEPAIAPADVGGEVASEPADAADPAPVESVESVEPVEPVEPVAVEQPSEEPGPGELPSWQADPVAPPTQGGTGEEVGVDEWGVPVAPPPPDPTPPKGGGLYAAAGGLFGFLITRQWITSLVCEDVHCGFRGNLDRGLGLGVMALAAGGGWLDGRRAAYIRHRDGEAAKRPTGRRAAGWTLFALGLGGLIADTALYNLCYQQALGPYTKIDGFRYTCSPVTSVVITDFSIVVGSVGIGLGMSAESQLRNRKKLDVSVLPFGGQGRAGLAIAGKF